MNASAARIIRICTLAPLLAAVMLVFLYAAQPEIFGSLGGLLRQLLFLSLFPLLAYPVQPMIPSFREKGREGQRHLAMIFAFAGHLFDGIVNICVPSSRELILIGWVYLLSGIAILLCNRLFRLRASGHAAGVGAVIGLLVLTGHPRTLAVTLPLLFLGQYCGKTAYAPAADWRDTDSHCMVRSAIIIHSGLLQMTNDK